MRAIISMQPDLVVLGQASDAEMAIDLFRRLEPDVTLMDLHLPGMSGIAATRTIRNEYPHARVIVLTTYSSEEHVRGAVEAGARAYLLKESLRTELIDAIRVVHSGGRYIPKEIALRLADGMAREPMTSREREVLSLMSKGLRNREIGVRLSIAEGTVKVHVKNILGKLEAADRTQAIVTALRRGIARLD